MDACTVVKNVAWALQYHVILDTILTSQVLRIRNFLNVIDAQLLPALGNFNPPRRPYQPISIGTLWQNFVHDRVVKARTQAVDFMNEYWNQINEELGELKDDPNTGFPDNFEETFNLEAFVHQVVTNGGIWSPSF